MTTAGVQQDPSWTSTFVEALPGIVYVGLDTGELKTCSSQIEFVLGFDAETVATNPACLREAVLAEDLKRFVATRQSAREKGYFEAEYRVRDTDGGIHWFWDRSFNIRSDEEPLLIEGFILDITHRKETEQKLLEKLKEREVLLQEIYHRVRNNLQVVNSLLNLQAREIEDEKALRAIKESIHRIRSMAMAHEQLSNSQMLHSIPFNPYLERLLRSLKADCSSQLRLTVATDSTGVVLPLSQAVPCGLFINELVLAFCRYVRIPDDHVEIEFGLRKTEKGFAIEVREYQGCIRLPKGSLDQLGLSGGVIAALAEQLQGRLSMETQPHFQLRLEIPRSIPRQTAGGGNE